MESSWSYDCAGKGFMLSNEIVTPPDFLNARTRNGFTNWGLMKGPYGYDVNTMLLSSHQNALENQGNLEVGFIDMIRKQSPHDSLRNCLSSNGSGGGDVINMQTIAANAISGEEESSSKLSNSANSRDSSLIDLKLGRFGDNLNYHTTIRSATVMSSSDSSTPAKRVKACSLNSQAAFCQVYGCYKDLSSSKDYHKRHKVCDVHSKTTKVVVNGLEQRFCQQCSRFHLLGEFDDGKRSCRRRLAGHNERRRKPQVGFHSGRAARLLHAYNGFGGTRPDAATVSSTSFICQDILPSHTHPEKCKHPKLEDSADFASKLACNWVDGHVLQKSVYPSPYGSIMKQCPHSQSLMTASVFNDHQYHPRDNNVSCSLFQNNVFDTASTVSSFPELSSKPGCALSLLSSQPQSSNPLIMPVNVSLHNFGISDGPFGVSSKYPLYRVPNSVGGSQLNPVDLSNGNTIDVGSGFNGGFFNGSEYVNVKDGGPSFDDEATIDLLQLSSQLQRVEHQRQVVSVKQEDKSFCYLKIT